MEPKAGSLKTSYKLLTMLISREREDKNHCDEDWEVYEEQLYDNELIS
jgi:hypothetical protein